jgi:hypothetical protein
MAITQFDAPAKLTEDLTTLELKKGWSDTISQFMDDGKAFVRQYLHTSPLQFYNELTDAQDETDRAELPIIWQGFPRLIEVQHGEGTIASFQAGEDRQTQDEYLEWHVTREPATSKIVRIEFTCEGPEYWSFLADKAPDLVVAQYQKYVSADVKKIDLFPGGGAYSPNSRWNSSMGAMHLTQINNTLGAEVNIAAAATIQRKDGHGKPITQAVPLIRCARYGVEQRASDPHIGSEVNRLARDGYTITLRNPVGLYIDGINIAGITKPDGTAISAAYFQTVRGGPGETLRAMFSVPAGEKSGGQPFTVSDLKVDGMAVQYGGQIAKRISMKLTGVAVGKGKIPAKLFACGGPPPSPFSGAVKMKTFPSRA